MSDFPSADFGWASGEGPTRLLAILNAEGEARFVGGCVRDSLLGLPPGTKGRTDIDIATTLTPDRTTAVLEAAGVRNIPTGIEHGTITAVIEGEPYEITTLRADVETDGRHAVVAFTTDWREDAARRDFTINALYRDAEGKITDYFSGGEDLAAGRVRFIGMAEERIREDYLRILRFLRFSSRFADTLDEEGWRACVALKDGIASLSRERVWSETAKLFATAKAPLAIAAAAADGVLAEICPAVSQPQLFSSLHGLRGGSLSPAEGVAALWPSAERDVLKAAFKPSTALLNDVELLREAAALILSGSDPRQVLYRAGRELGIMAAYLTAAEVGDELDPDYLETLETGDIPVLPFKGGDFIALGVPKGPAVTAAMRAFEAAWIAAGFPLDETSLSRLQKIAAAEV